MFGADLVVSLTNTSIGLAGATLIAQDWHAGWLIIPPAAVLILAYRAYLSEHTKHQSLEFLYGVARSLSRAPDVETRAGRPARAHARVLPRAHGGDHPVRRRRRAAAAHLARRRRRDADDAARRARARDRAARLPARRARRRRGSRGRRRRRSPPTWPSTGSAEAAIAPVPGETRLVGVMLLGDRLGATADFTSRTCGCSRRSRATPACRSSSTASSRRSGACASCRARSSARPTAIRSPTSPTARCSCAACTSR